MDSELLSEKFERMGARVKLAPAAQQNLIAIDIRKDRKGEYFDLRIRAGAQPRVEVVDLRPKERHLLLMVGGDGESPQASRPQKFLCGHDERAWFVAAVPERAAISGVRTAMEALKPWTVRDSQERRRVRFDDRNHRKNRGFVRQGEWFFVPVRGRAMVRPADILRDEPLQRTGGKPHYAEFACRFGGEAVYVHSRSGEVLTAPQYQRQVARGLPTRDWRPTRRNATVIVKGRIRHPDHKTITLREWHQVVMNTEHESEAMRFVAFLD